MPTLYTQQSSNIRRTWVLMSTFLIVIIALGWVFSLAYGNSYILYAAVAVSVAMSLVGYWSSDKIALSLSHAAPIARQDSPQFYDIVENLCIASGLPMPALYITPERQINAFATGRDPRHASIAVTQGALERLDKDELEGVLAHELSHVGNRDILVSTVAVVLAGVISLLGDFFLRSLFFGRGRRDNDGEGGLFLLIGIALSILAPIGAMLIQLAISRHRESLADTSGVLLTRYPEGLIAALRKIGADSVPMRTANDSTAHLWIDTPFKGSGASWWHKLFMTHPPIEERIKALEAVSL